MWTRHIIKIMIYASEGEKKKIQMTYKSGMCVRQIFSNLLDFLSISHAFSNKIYPYRSEADLIFSAWRVPLLDNSFVKLIILIKMT